MTFGIFIVHIPQIFDRWLEVTLASHTGPSSMAQHHSYNSTLKQLPRVVGLSTKALDYTKASCILLGAISEANKPEDIVRKICGLDRKLTNLGSVLVRVFINPVGLSCGTGPKSLCVCFTSLPLG